MNLTALSLQQPCGHSWKNCAHDKFVNTDPITATYKNNSECLISTHRHQLVRITGINVHLTHYLTSFYTVT